MQNNIPKDVITFFHALQQEFNHVQFLGSIRQKPHYLKHEYFFNVNGQLYSIWQTHNDEWWWSDPPQTMMNMNYIPKRYEKEIGGQWIE